MTPPFPLAGNIPAGGLKFSGARDESFASGGDIWSQRKT